MSAPTTWPEVLDRLEADALRLAEAACATPDALEAACTGALATDALELGPLPVELADRATVVLRTLAEAEAAVAQRAVAARHGMDTLAASERGGAPARYIDQDV